eukprot:NODE_198_length_15297_cov_0.486182.p9 type:complete len:221 gc:universal NODE_198_length_15297_cov_0.486182:5693-6355(+)
MEDNDQIFNQIFGSSSEDEEHNENELMPIKRQAQVEEYTTNTNEPISRLDQFRLDFDNAKSTQKSKRAKTNASNDFSYERIKDIIGEMYKAAQIDRESMISNRSKAGLAKLVMLPYLTETLNREKLQESFLDAGLLGAFQAWLEPHDNGCMPLYDVKHTLLVIMMHLKVDLDHLRECNIGKIVHFYTLNKVEHPNIRKLAQQLRDKWSKPEKAENVYEKD